MSWIAWAVLILVQNASFTTVSRARNSGSYSYHAIASVFSNGIWFWQMYLVVDIYDQIKQSSWSFAVLAALFYITFTVIGSVSTHYILRTHVEHGNRRVGA